MHDVLDAIEAFFAHLSSVELVPLLIAVGCHLVKLACTSRAWRNVIAAAYPDERVPWPPILGAYVVGVGVNAVVPARAGDVMRLYLAHRAVPGSTYTTLASTYVVMAITDTALAVVLFAYALTLGVLPGLSLLPDLRSFDFAWFIDHPAGRPGSCSCLPSPAWHWRSGCARGWTTSMLGSPAPSRSSASRRATSAASSRGSSPTGPCGW